MRQYEDWRFLKGAIDPPEEYVDFVLCTKVYGCLPSDLDEQDALTVDLHLEFWAKEQEAARGKKTKFIGKRIKRGEYEHIRDHHQGQRPGQQNADGRHQ